MTVVISLKVKHIHKYFAGSVPVGRSAIYELTYINITTWVGKTKQHKNKKNPKTYVMGKKWQIFTPTYEHCDPQERT